MKTTRGRLKAVVFTRKADELEYIVDTYERDTGIHVIEDWADEAREPQYEREARYPQGTGLEIGASADTRAPVEVRLPEDGPLTMSHEDWERRRGLRPTLNNAVEYLAQRSTEIDGDPSGCWYWDRDQPIPWSAVWAGLHDGRTVPDDYFVGVSCANKKTCCRPDHLTLVRRRR